MQVQNPREYIRVNKTREPGWCQTTDTSTGNQSITSGSTRPDVVWFREGPPPKKWECMVFDQSGGGYDNLDKRLGLKAALPELKWPLSMNILNFHLSYGNKKCQLKYCDSKFLV